MSTPIITDPIAHQVIILTASLGMQPNVGNDAARFKWLQTIQRAQQLADAPVEPTVRACIQDDWNLRHAKSLLQGVEFQALHSGLVIADLRSGYSANLGRFSPSPRSTEGPQAQIHALPGGDAIEISPFKKAEVLVNRLFSNEIPLHQTLVMILDKAFEAHIKRLDRQVDLIEKMAMTREVPENAAYPRDFEKAHPVLMDYLHQTLVELNQGRAVSLFESVLQVMNHLKARQTEREGITTVDEEQGRRGLSIALQIPAYSAFQLLCLLIQIRKGCVDNALVTQLKNAFNGRTITKELALAAGVRSEDLLAASRLMGNIDVIHANIKVAIELARNEHPGVPFEIVVKLVYGAVAQLGQETGHSRREYDDGVAWLKALDTNRSDPPQPQLTP